VSADAPALSVLVAVERRDTETDTQSSAPRVEGLDRLVSHAENQLHLRKTHCKHGHPLSGDNLRIGPNRVRICRGMATRPTSARSGGAPRPPEPLARTPHRIHYVNYPFERPSSTGAWQL
jgi:hypothetical protein